MSYCQTTGPSIHQKHRGTKGGKSKFKAREEREEERKREKENAADAAAAADSLCVLL